MRGAPRTIAFHTLGCRLNASDTQRLEERALERGLRIVAFTESADVYVVNTCTVTAQADQQCRKLSRQARARNPNAIVAAVGCWVQAQPDAAASLPELDFTLDNWHKDSFFDELGARTVRRLPVIAAEDPDAPPADSLDAELGSADVRRHRAFLKVQDGCDETCAYCIIPRARGGSRSRALDDVVADAERLVRQGYREIVVVGVHLSDWGRTLPGAPNLATLIRRLCAVDELPRLRISSLEPEGLTGELLDALDHPKICRHLHLPIQSGSARILRAMRRAYEPDAVERSVERAAERWPDLGLGSDFLLGFPGETERDYRDTFELVERLPFSYLHAFPYSPRPGTDAASLPDQIPVPERDRRVRELNALGKAKRAAFMRDRVGRDYDGWLYPGATPGSPRLRALTGNYLTMSVTAPPERVNTFARVKITAFEQGALQGAILDAAVP